ncbi:TPA: GHKL domain-containing protein [Enterococcus faecium]
MNLLFFMAMILSSGLMSVSFFKINLISLSKIKLFFGVMSAVLIVAVLFGFSRFPEYQLLTLIAIFSFSSCLYKKQWDFKRLEKDIILSEVIVLIISFSNYLGQSIFNIIFQQYYSSIIFVSLSNILLLTISIFVITKIPQSFYEGVNRYFTDYRYAGFSISILSLILFVFSSFTAVNRKNTLVYKVFLSNKEFMILFVSVGLFIFLILMFIDFYYLEKRNNQQYLNSLNNYNIEIEKLNEELGMFRHDYVNILLSLKSGIDEGNLDSIRSIYYDLILPTEKIVNDKKYEITKLNRIKTIEVKSLLASKVTLAKTLGKKVKLEVPDTIMIDLKNQLLEIIRIYSILLDNAIKYSVFSEEEIIISLFSADGKIVLIVSNSFNSRDFDIFKFSQNRYTSSNIKKNHGFGLTYIRELVETRPNFELKTEINEKRFTQYFVIT